ncbi:MAG: alpha/beta fold hydrolase [Anaerolineae bacterium]|nr:alpha/beta fold hydrolase [Anaerolineae bacterium]
MISEEIIFTNKTVQLAGTLYKPETQMAHPAVVVLHAANGGTRQFPFYQHLVTHLPAHGIAVLLFDRRGSGRSSGDFETASFETLAKDGSTAVDYLRSRDDIDKKQIGLYGISQGGWVAPLVAGLRPDIAFLIIVSGCGVSPAKQMDYGAAYTLRQEGFSDNTISQAIALRNRVNEYYRGHLSREVVSAELDNAQSEPWFQNAYINPSTNLPEDVTKKKWWYELDYDPLPIWKKLSQPTLFLFAKDDRWVPVEESISKLELATSHLNDVTILQIPETDHLMYQTSNPTAEIISDEYVETMVTWLLRHVG